MKIRNANVFITGANRGLGLAFAREVLARGARKVYAGARDPSKLTLPTRLPPWFPPVCCARRKPWRLLRSSTLSPFSFSI